MSTPPPGFNPSESLLSGGTDQPIVPVMGGGSKLKPKPKPARVRSKSRSSRSRSRSKSRERHAGGANPFKLVEPAKASDKGTNFDLVSLTFSVMGVHTHPSLEDADIENTEIKITEYAQKQQTMWRRIPRTGVSTTSPQMITADAINCSSMKQPARDKSYLGYGGFDRLCYIAPSEITDVILLPPVKGNIETFTGCRNLFREKKGGLNTPNTLIVFTPPLYKYYGEPGFLAADNITIFNHFIALKKECDRATMLALTEHTYGSTYLNCNNLNTVRNNHTVAKLEPTYILIPSIKKHEGKTYQGVILSAAAEDEAILPESTSKDVLGAIGAADKGKTGGISFKPNPKQEDSLLNTKKYGYKKIRFFANSRTLPDIETIEDGTIHALRFGNNETTIFDENTTGKVFTASTTVFLTGVSMVSIPLGSRQFLLRHPRTPEVKREWERLIFTEEEADFLNAMQLRPDALAEIFPDATNPWQKVLAGNLATIVRSKCFNDNRLVLHSDCQESQRFITKVLEYYVTHEKRVKQLETRDVSATDRQLQLQLDKKMQAPLPRKQGATKADPFKAKGSLPPALLRPRPYTGINSSVKFGIVYNEKDIGCDEGANYTKEVVVVDPLGKQTPRVGVLQLNTSGGINTVEQAEADMRQSYAAIKAEYTGYFFWP